MQQYRGQREFFRRFQENREARQEQIEHIQSLLNQEDRSIIRHRNYTVYNTLLHPRTTRYIHSLSHPALNDPNIGSLQEQMYQIITKGIQETTREIEESYRNSWKRTQIYMRQHFLGERFDNNEDYLCLLRNEMD